MNGYHAWFTKANGDEREISFIRMPDLPETFLEEKVKNTGRKRVLKEGMELVWDVQAHGFRTFNWDTVVGEVQEIIFKESVITS